MIVKVRLDEGDEWEELDFDPLYCPTACARLFEMDVAMAVSEWAESVDNYNVGEYFAQDGSGVVEVMIGDVAHKFRVTVEYYPSYTAELEEPENEAK